MAPPTTIDHLGMDLLHNILARLSSIDFASADCVSRSWNHVCGRILCRPKLSSACSFNQSLQVAVEEVVNKVLSERIRPHFAIASVGTRFHIKFNIEQAHKLITAKLGSKVPLITNCSPGIIGRDVNSGEFKEASRAYGDTSITDEFDRSLVQERAKGGIMLTVGFLPGLKVKLIKLAKEDLTSQDARAYSKKFINDIREFSASISGCQSPAAIMMFSEPLQGVIDVMEKVDHAMSPETVIVGDYGYRFHSDTESLNNITATKERVSAVVALVFVMDRTKPLGMRETQFHTIISNGLLPIGPVYEISVKERSRHFETVLIAKREGSNENIDAGLVIGQAFREINVNHAYRPVYIGVTKRRKCSIGQNKARWMTSLAFHRITKFTGECFFVDDMDMGIKTGDTFRFYYTDPATALSSIANVSNHLRSFKQERTAGGDKQEVFGGFIFTSFGRSELFFEKPNANSSPFLDNFPSATLGGILCGPVFGRGDLNSYLKESQDCNSVSCCMHEYGGVYFIMSYTP